MLLTQYGQQVDLQWPKTPSPEHVGAPWNSVVEDVLSRCRRDVERNPRSARARTNHALALINANNADQAVDELRAALDVESNHYAAGMLLARLLAQRGDYEQAETLYQSIVRTYPKDPAAPLSLAHIAMRRGDLEHARALLSRVVTLDERSAFSRYAYGVILLRLRRYREAIGQLKNAVRLDVSSPALHQSLGVAYAVSGDFRRASRAFRTALNLSPRSSGILLNLGRALLQQREYDQAIELLKGYVEFEQGDNTARELLARACHGRHQHQAERVHLNHILRSLSGEDESSLRERCRLMNNIAVSFTLDRKWKEAGQMLQAALVLAHSQQLRTYPNLYHNMARLYLSTNEFGHAEELLTECQRLFPGEPDTHLLFSLAFEKQDRYPEAMQQLEYLNGSGKGTADSFAVHGCFVADVRRDYEAALTILRDAFKRFGSSPTLVNNLAYVQLMSGDPASARETLSCLPKNMLLPAASRVTLTATRGLLRLWEGDFVSAVNLYREAARLAAAHGEANLARAAKQKMHLELARAFTRVSDYGSALKEVRRGIRIPEGRKMYREDLAELERKVVPLSPQGRLF